MLHGLKWTGSKLNKLGNAPEVLPVRSGLTVKKIVLLKKFN